MTPPLYLVSDSPRRMNRRSFLLATSSLAAAAAWSCSTRGRVVHQPRFSDYPFQLGIASGDPSPDGFVIWTRLAPKPLEGGGMDFEPVAVEWQVAEDENMSRVVKRGRTVATPEWAHSVHVEVDGLRPDRWYWYRFRAGSEESPVGRTRTFPALGAMPQNLRFAFASCQHYETGLYTAYERMAEDDLDMVVHLGDYIYEGAAQDGRVRRHNSREIETLDEYRNRLALYKTDEHLKRMHASVPWLVTWDDHEFENNCANDISEQPGVLRGAFLRRRANAYKAYYEHMPLRRRSLPHGPDMTLYRRVPFGRLADFNVLDTRQYRTDQPCGDGNKPPCDESLDPNATALGTRQREWLMRNLSESPAVWNVLAQQIMMARADRKAGPEVTHSMDQWPGYEMERRQLLKFFAEQKISNPVVLTGDIHTNWANDLLIDFDDLESRSVATEFVGTSISSSGDGTPTPSNQQSILSENPFVRFYNAERGYVRCHVTPDQWKTDYRTVEYVSRPGAPANIRASFVIESGQPRLQSA